MPMILVDMVLIYSDIMWVKQCHKPSHSHHHFNRCYVYHSQSWVVYAYGPKTVLVKRTFLQTRGRRLCWGGVGWGGHVNVLSSAYIRCCYAAEISVVSLLRYMLLCCRDLWYPCYVTCCYAAEISCGILATLHVATLQRSLVSLLRYMLLRCSDLWYPCYVTCCYAAEIPGILATLHVATLQRSLVSLLRYMLLRCRDLWYPCYVTCCYAANL